MSAYCYEIAPTASQIKKGVQLICCNPLIYLVRRKGIPWCREFILSEAKEDKLTMNLKTSRK